MFHSYAKRSLIYKSHDDALREREKAAAAKGVAIWRPRFGV